MRKNCKVLTNRLILGTYFLPLYIHILINLTTLIHCLSLLSGEKEKMRNEETLYPELPLSP